MTSAPTEPETIAAVLTAEAPGAIAVIALRGPMVLSILTRVLRRPGVDEPPRLSLRSPVFCRFVDDKGAVDDVVAILTYVEPIPCAEICTHGGIAVVRRVTDVLAEAGVRIVNAEDFPHSLRSSDPIQREIDAALIHAPSRRMAQWLLEQRNILPQAIRGARSWSPQERAAFESRSRAAIRLVRGITIAIVGPPNAGKSTLANRLIGSDRIITSHEPGTTRDWVSEIALIRGWPVTLTDTAGVRSTECEIEQEAIRRGISRATVSDLALIVLALDESESARSESIRLFEQFLPGDLPRIMILNKADLSPHGVAGQSAVTSISALHGQGIEGLEAAIEAALGLDELKLGLPAALTESRLGAFAPDLQH